MEYENVQKEVDSLRSRLFELRESKILNSNLAKKIKKISQTVQPNHSEAPVSEKMWIDIEVLMMEVYPSVIKVLKDAACHHRRCIFVSLHYLNLIQQLYLSF